MIYRANVVWYFDENEHKEACFVIANSIAEAASKVVDIYGEDEIISAEIIPTGAETFVVSTDTADRIMEELI